MTRKLLLFSILTLILTGCQTGVPPAAPDSPAPVSLPETWTPQPSLTPVLNPTSEGPNPTTTPTPWSTGTGSAPTTSPVSPISPSPTRSRLHYPTPMPLVSGMEFDLLYIEMFTPQRGWAMGSQRDHYAWILATGDGGRTWTDRTPQLKFYNRGKAGLEDIAVHFQDELTALVLFHAEVMGEDYGVHRVWRTADGGESWLPSEQLPLPINTHHIEPEEFFFLNEHNGWLRLNVGLNFGHNREDACLFRTVDGGDNWELVNQPGDSQIEARENSAMAFANQYEGWMVKDSLGDGYFPFLEHTRDGGQSWAWVSLPAPDGSWEYQDRRCLGLDPHFFRDGSGAFLLNCLAYDEDLEDYDPEMTTSYLYRSPDYWVNWEIQELPSAVSQLVFLEQDLGFALGREHYRTRDGGQSWELIKTVNWDGQFSFISAEEAFALAWGSGEIALVHTMDGLETFQIIKTVLIE